MWSHLDSSLAPAGVAAILQGHPNNPEGDGTDCDGVHTMGPSLARPGGARALR